MVRQYQDKRCSPTAACSLGGSLPRPGGTAAGLGPKGMNPAHTNINSGWHGVSLRAYLGSNLMGQDQITKQQYS